VEVVVQENFDSIPNLIISGAARSGSIQHCEKEIETVLTVNTITIPEDSAKASPLEKKASTQATRAKLPSRASFKELILKKICRLIM
jgi:hypothetical protein